VSVSVLEQWRQRALQSGWPATWPAWLAIYFIVSLLLDRLSGWHVGSAHALLAGMALSVLMFRQQPKIIGLFFLSLLAAIAWMSFRDVLEGAGWKASERTVKAAILTLGMLACCRLPSSLWKLTLAVVLPCGLVIITAYIGPGQMLHALQMPLDLGAAGGLVTAMNRNGLALPLGLLSCWAVAAACQLRPRWFWLLPAVVLAVLMVANGSRNALAAFVVAVLIMLFRYFPGKVLLAGLGVLLLGLLVHHLVPDYWVHGTVLSYRDVIWAEVFRHLPEHLWIGAGSEYFRQSVAPGLPIEVIIAHNAYLDFLLAYGVIGVLLMTFSGLVLARLVHAWPLNGQAIWLYGSFGFLAMFGLFDRGHLDALMLAAMLMIPSSLMAIWSVARHGVLAGAYQPPGKLR